MSANLVLLHLFVTCEKRLDFVRDSRVVYARTRGIFQKIQTGSFEVHPWCGYV